MKDITNAWSLLLSARQFDMPEAISRLTREGGEDERVFGASRGRARVIVGGGAEESMTWNVLSWVAMLYEWESILVITVTP